MLMMKRSLTLLALGPVAAGKPRLLGFKFLRLEENPLANLRQLDGADAPRVTLPGGGNAGF